MAEPILAKIGYIILFVAWMTTPIISIGLTGDYDVNENIPIFLMIIYLLGSLYCLLAVGSFLGIW